MLTRWWLPLHGIVPRWVTPTYVHAAVSRLFDTTDDDHRANRKAYTISPAADGPGGPGIEVGTLTAETAEVFRAAVAKAPEVRLGRQFGQFGPPVSIASASYEQLLASPPQKAWAVDFSTPVVFRDGQRWSPLPYPATLLHSLARRWNSVWPEGVQIPSAAECEHIWVSSISGESVPVVLPGAPEAEPPRGFLGQVEYRCGRPELAALFTTLLAFADFAGSGAGTARGLGVTRVLITSPQRAAR